MSWRTQGQYLGLGESDAAFLREFDCGWERKAQGRSQTDAMEYSIQTDGIEQRSVPPEDAESLPIDALLISLGPQISKIDRPHPYRFGWRFYIFLRTGRKARAFFDDYESAAQAYLAACEFMHWFQPIADSDLGKQQEGGSPRRETGSPLANRPAQDGPRERGRLHLAITTACPATQSSCCSSGILQPAETHADSSPTQNPFSNSTQSLSPLARSSTS